MDTSNAKMECHTVTPPGAMERAFAVLVLLMGSGAFMTLATTQGQMSNQAGGILGLQILWALTYLITFTLLLRYCPGSFRQIIKEWPLVGFVALALISTFWSDDPSITFRRSVALCLTVMFGFYLARRFSLREQLRLFAWTCGICIFSSVPFQLLHVGSAVSNMLGAWYGIFVDKSIFGIVMAFAVLVFMLLGKAEPSLRFRSRLGLLGALALMVLSRSATPFVETGLMFILLPLSGVLRKRLGKALVVMALAAIAGAVVLFLVFTHWAAFTGALGRGQTMSGRLQLWVLCGVMALRRPWFGYGYSAFWLGWSGPSYRIIRAFGIPISHAHNAFIQTWLDLGLAGVALLVLILTLHAFRAVRLVRRTKQPEAVWPLMLLAFIFLFMLTKVPIPTGNTLFMMVFSSSVFAASPTILERVGEPTSGLQGHDSQPRIRPRISSFTETSPLA